MTPVDIALANARVQAANARLEEQAKAAPTIETYNGVPFSVAPRVTERELPDTGNLAQTVASGGMSYAPQLPDTGRSGIYYHPAGAREAYEQWGIPMPIYQDDPYATATGRVVQTPWGLGWQALQGAVSRYPHVLNGVPQDFWSRIAPYMPQIPMWPQAAWQPPQAMPRPAAAPASGRQTAPASPPVQRNNPPASPPQRVPLRLIPQNNDVLGAWERADWAVEPPVSPSQRVPLRLTPQNDDVLGAWGRADWAVEPNTPDRVPLPLTPQVAPSEQPTIKDLQPPVPSAAPSRWFPPDTGKPWYAEITEPLARLGIRFPQATYQPPEDTRSLLEPLSDVTGAIAREFGGPFRNFIDPPEIKEAARRAIELRERQRAFDYARRQNGIFD